ncbi:MAG: tRNA preQ1(34) S-adenosylmethionine ribosyltransferase-isomerase QueA [Candidatus Omnitrophica bacterium]|nr:tRNA preQ1(34) S-adenosylmethionine ribosyltransferase-isomerase QueA [Candidatus Omnitrophota bacterium]MCF7894223.1 tRNA preQ1(34) S-adenosylmethionine ribosyltransferase-isomerase QueA [Candidatus Omnitrophota bacterium]
MEKDNLAAANYDFKIPKELIAQSPRRPRDKSRLLVLDRKSKELDEKVFSDIVNFFQKGDCLVLNNTKVFKARIFGKKETGAKIEIFLLQDLEKGVWQCLVKPAKRAKIGSKVFFLENFQAEVKERTEKGLFIVQFQPQDIKKLIENAGKTPLPPYIKKESELESYQTVYAKNTGAVAAPTAGLHFTKSLIDNLEKKGVKIIHLTLHCGLGTFQPIKEKNIRDHQMAEEYLEISKKTAEIINRAKSENKKIFAVGTTAVRSLESAANNNSQLTDYQGQTSLYIIPGYKFKIVDALITNFHTPLSTNLVLVSSFSSLELIKKAYCYAQKNKFRFFSFGDAMIII